MNYIITLATGKEERKKALAVGVAPTGALMLGDSPQQFSVMYAPGFWVKCEVSPIAVIENGAN